jgi:lysophospholipase L1-like esterase
MPSTRLPRAALLGALLSLVGVPALGRPSEHYEKRMARFAEQKAGLDPAKRHVVLVGDSLTEAWEARGRTAKYLPALADRVLNRGIGGDTTRGLARRLDESIYSLNPSHVVLNIGVNDLASEAEAAPAGERFAALVKGIREKLASVPLIVVTVAPCRGRFAVRNPWIVAYDEHVRRAAAATGCALIDLHAQVVDEKGELPEALAVPDGIHWSDAMYERLGEEIQKAVAGGKE